MDGGQEAKESGSHGKCSRRPHGLSEEVGQGDGDHERPQAVTLPCMFVCVFACTHEEEGSSHHTAHVYTLVVCGSLACMWRANTGMGEG